MWTGFYVGLNAGGTWSNSNNANVASAPFWTLPGLNGDVLGAQQAFLSGLLHDFGKVGVREQVLVKAKKLYPPDLSLIARSRGAERKRRIINS